MISEYLIGAMERFLLSFLHDPSGHPSDDKMASFLCRELPFGERIIAKQHLAKCWHCRVRKEALAGRRADRMLRLYRDALEAERIPAATASRVEFMRRLRSELKEASPRKQRPIRLPQTPPHELINMNPATAMLMALSFATAVSFLFWWQQRLPDITSNSLLARAERWDTPSLLKSSGVVFQAVRITTPHQTMERSIYRDLEGRRRQKHVKLDAKEDQLRSTLLRAGLDWDEPISASNYQGWHDSQHVREDRIVRAGRHLLTLTTTVPDGSVSQQSLTVRDSDFHPIRRMVSVRDFGTVEIAEVDFKILPWQSLDADLFEPAGGATTLSTARSARVLSFPRVHQKLTEYEFEESELGARLVLNQLHADTGEQITIARSQHGVEVKGIVDTEERKRELQMQLAIVPHLTASIQSISDLKDDPAVGTSVTSVEASAAGDQPSILETYLLISGRSVETANGLAHRLFESALAVSQEGNALRDLQRRFVPEEQKTVLASAMLTQLLSSHRERLQAALAEERELLDEAGSIDVSDGGGASGSHSTLTEEASRNLTLCKELTQTNRVSARTAGQILAEMARVVDGLSGRLHASSGGYQSDAALDGKR